MFNIIMGKYAMEPNEITRCFCYITKVMAWDCNRITIKKKGKNCIIFSIWSKTHNMKSINQKTLTENILIIMCISLCYDHDVIA